MLALKSALPSLPVIAGLSATISPPSTCPWNCAVFTSPATTTRPVPCRRTFARRAAGLDIRELVPVHGDFNLDLCRWALTAFAHVSRTSSPHPTACASLIAVPMRSGEPAARLRVPRCRPGRKKGFGLLPAVCPSRNQGAARAAFTSGDLPEAPGGGGGGKEAALIRFAMARCNYFPPPPWFGVIALRAMIVLRRGGFASRNKIVARPPSSASLRPSGSETVSASGKGIAVKAAIGAADPPAKKGPRDVTQSKHLPLPRRRPRSRKRSLRRVSNRASARRAGAVRPPHRPG